MHYIAFMDAVGRIHMFFYISNPLPFISGLNYATKIVFLLLLYFL